MIADPVERKKCENYEGKYAKSNKSSNSPVKGSMNNMNKKPSSGMGY